MKKLIAAIVFVAGTVAVSQAQNVGGLRAEIPFAFYVGDKLMSAGEYDLTNNVAHRVTLVRDTEWKDGAMILALINTKAEAPKTSTLVFRKYGENRYFLGEIWHAGEREGIAYSKSKREKEAVSSLLITSAKPETVIIIARAF